MKRHKNSIYAQAHASKIFSALCASKNVNICQKYILYIYIYIHIPGCILIITVAKEVRISRHLQYRYRPFYATKQTDKEEKNNDDFALGKNAGVRSI
jgi:hypothetical protein